MSAPRTEHTPGPWLIDDEGTIKRQTCDLDGNYIGYELLDGDYSMLVPDPAMPVLLDQRAALLAALEESLPWLEGLWRSHRDAEATQEISGIASRARAAIALARGGK